MTIHKTDKYGRPVLYYLLRRAKPSEAKDEDMIKFLFYLNWQIKQKFEKHIDSYLNITDLKDVGKKNLNISQLKKCIPIVGNNNPELSPVGYFIRPGWLIWTLYATIKPFIHPNTQKKIVFVNESDLLNSLLKYIPIENIPVEYGGKDEEFAKLFD